jgi:hypothetical protein
MELSQTRLQLTAAQQRLELEQDERDVAAAQALVVQVR